MQDVACDWRNSCFRMAPAISMVKAPLGKGDSCDDMNFFCWSQIPSSPDQPSCTSVNVAEFF